MLKNHLFTLYDLITSRMSHITKFMFATLLLAGLSLPGMSITKEFSYTDIRNKIDPLSAINPITATTDRSQQAFQPGHDFGAIYGATDPGINLRTDPSLFTYWVNGQMVVRRYELGPLTDPVEASLPLYQPGHDFGAIYGASDPGINLPSSQLKSISPVIRRR